MLLVVTCAIVIEAVLLRQPASVAGPGLLVGAVLAVWQWSRLRAGRQVRTATLAADGQWQLDFEDGRTAPARLARGSRLLGPSAVLSWRVNGHPLAVWLTPADLPGASLRALRVRLAGASLRAGT